VTELTDHLLNFTASIDVQILQGSKVVEVRPAGVNKGLAALRWISSQKHDFILAIGDDWTDEDLFAILPEDAYSIRVGVTSTRARFNLKNADEVIGLLQCLAQCSSV
jgi:trehalose 6-phosphate synthase/phosphatase